LKKKERKDRPPVKAKPAPAVNPKENCKNNSKKKRPTIQEFIATFAKEEQKIKEHETVESIKDTLLRFVMFLDKKGFEIVDTQTLICVPFRYAVFTSRLK